MIEERIKKIIAECGVVVEMQEIDGNTDLVTDLGFDSIALIQLVISLEGEFLVEINDDDLVIENLFKFENLVKTIKGKLS